MCLAIPLFYNNSARFGITFPSEASRYLTDVLGVVRRDSMRSTILSEPASTISQSVYKHAMRFGMACRQVRAHIGMLDDRLLVEAGHGAAFFIGYGVEDQDVFHRRHELAAYGWVSYPGFIVARSTASTESISRWGRRSIRT